jgi:hypothetical protein
LKHVMYLFPVLKRYTEYREKLKWNFRHFFTREKDAITELMVDYAADRSGR